MTTGARTRRKPGPPRGDGKRRSVVLDDWTVSRARGMGAGNLSLGLRVAVAGAVMAGPGAPLAPPRDPPVD